MKRMILTVGLVVGALLLHATGAKAACEPEGNDSKKRHKHPNDPNTEISIAHNGRGCNGNARPVARVRHENSEHSVNAVALGNFKKEGTVLKLENQMVYDMRNRTYAPQTLTIDPNQFDMNNPVVQQDRIYTGKYNPTCRFISSGGRYFAYCW